MRKTIFEALVLLLSKRTLSGKEVGGGGGGWGWKRMGSLGVDWWV